MKNKDMSTLISRAPIYVEDENAIWMITIYSAFLVKIDLTTNRVEEYYKIPTFKFDTRFYCASMCKCGDELILAPNKGDKIIIFNIKTHIFDYIEMPMEENEKIEDSKINAICIGDKYVYLVGYAIYAMFRYDIENRTCERIYSSTGEGIFSYGKVKVFENKLYVPMYEKSTLLIMDLKTNQVKEKQIETEGENGFSSIVTTEKGIGLITRDGNYILYDIEKKKQKNTIKLCEHEIFDSVIGKENDIWCFEFLHDSIWHILKNSTVEKIPFECPYSPIKNDVKYDMAIMTKNGIVFQTRADGCLYNLDVKTKVIRKINIEPDANLQRKIYEIRVKNEMISEKSKYDLVNYLEIVADRENDSEHDYTRG